MGKGPLVITSGDALALGEWVVRRWEDTGVVFDGVVHTTVKIYMGDRTCAAMTVHDKSLKNSIVRVVRAWCAAPVTPDAEIQDGVLMVEASTAEGGFCQLPFYVRDNGSVVTLIPRCMGRVFAEFVARRY